MDEEVFGVEEMAHGRKWPHLLFCDQWFERLWTRQEGLCGSLLDIVILNPVTCRRLQLSVGYKIRWMTEGTVMAKKFVAESFLFDKLAYHGLASSQSEKVHFELYLYFVYRHHVDIKKYGGIAGPALSYSPISEAWMSGRVTTKPRDYVLAVFPDINGYKVPLNARKMRFPELLQDALGQAPIQERFNIAPKVPKGMMLRTSSKESATSWMFQEPSNIGEAYDPFNGQLSKDPGTATRVKLFAVASSITLEDLDFDRSNMSGVKDIWVKTADNLKHMVLVSPSGPCTGTTRGVVQTAQGLLHQYFIRQFAPSAVALYPPKSKLETLAFPAGLSLLTESGTSLARCSGMNSGVSLSAYYVAQYCALPISFSIVRTLELSRQLTVNCLPYTS